MAATRWALRYLWLRVDGLGPDDVEQEEAAGLSAELTQMVARREFWSAVAANAVSGSNSDLAHLLSCRLPDRGYCPELPYLLGQAQARGIDESFLYDTVRSVAAIASAVQARMGEGLTSFVDRFEVMGLARDAAIGAFRERSLRLSLTNVLASREVVGAEFRKTISTASRREFRRLTADALTDHLRAFSDHTYADGQARTLVMPVGFIRNSLDSAGRQTPLGELEYALGAADGLADFIHSSSDPSRLAQAIYAVDVAGDELESSNWPLSSSNAIAGGKGSWFGEESACR